MAQILVIADQQEDGQGTGLDGLVRRSVRGGTVWILGNDGDFRPYVLQKDQGQDRACSVDGNIVGMMCGIQTVVHDVVHP